MLGIYNPTVAERIRWDGIVGLGHNGTGTSFVQNMNSEGVIDKAMVSFYINDIPEDEFNKQRGLEEKEEEVEVKRLPESHIAFGGWDTEVIQNVVWTEAHDEFWAFDFVDLKYGTHSLNTLFEIYMEEMGGGPPRRRRSL